MIAEKERAWKAAAEWVPAPSAFSVREPLVSLEEPE
jgi:hypothetical protein